MNSEHGSAHGALREAEACAQLIVAWHWRFGVAIMRKRLIDPNRDVSRDFVEQYLRSIESYLEADLGDTNVQVSLAHLQISGVFEAFYGAEIPPHLWERHWSDIHSDPPKQLYQAARRILQIHDSLERTVVEQEVNEDVKSIHEDSGERLSIQYSTSDELIAKARHYYRHYTGEEENGIGGANFLLSSSLERGTHGSGGSGQLTLLSPSVLGFTVADPEPNELIARIRKGEVRIESVTGH